MSQRCEFLTLFSSLASEKGWMLYAPRMRLTPGYSSCPMSTNATPWKGISGFSSNSYTHTAGSTQYRQETWKYSEPILSEQSRLTGLVSAAFPTGANDLIISTGHSRLWVIFCRSLKLQSTLTHIFSWFSVSVSLFLYFLLVLFPYPMLQLIHMHFWGSLDIFIFSFILFCYNIAIICCCSDQFS